MADDQPTTEPPATGDPAPAAPAAPPPDPEPALPADLGEAGRKAIDAERTLRKNLERQLRELEPLAEQARKDADARKSAEQKLAEKLTTAEANAQAARAELSKLQAAIAKMPAGFDPAQLPNVLKRLTGATPEELEADAVELFNLMAPAPPPPSAPNGQQRPVEQLRPGALPATPELSLADQIATAERAGDVQLSMRLKSTQLRELVAKQST